MLCVLGSERVRAREIRSRVFSESVHGRSLVLYANVTLVALLPHSCLAPGSVQSCGETRGNKSLDAAVLGAEGMDAPGSVVDSCVVVVLVWY